MSNGTARNRVVLVVLDGWGYRSEREGNAIELASTPIWHRLWDAYPRTLLDASGLAVGLPKGQMGNSEVGHLNLGAGAVVKQDLTRIDEAVAGGELSSNEAIRAAFDGFERVHLIGLVSDGGVHSSLEHLGALLELAGDRDVVVHAFVPEERQRYALWAAILALPLLAVLLFLVWRIASQAPSLAETVRLVRRSSAARSLDRIPPRPSLPWPLQSASISGVSVRIVRTRRGRLPFGV